MFHISAIGIERYIGTFRPLHFAQLLTTRRAYYIITTAWIYGFVSAIPTLTGILSWQSGTACNAFFVLPPTYIHICVIHIFATFVTLAALYVTIIILAHRHQRFMAKHGDEAPHVHTKKNLQLIRTCFMLVAIFAACHFPVAFILELKVILHSSSDIPWWVVGLVLPSLVLLSSGINCVIYTWRIPQFRVAVRQILCGPCGKRRDDQRACMSSYHISPLVLGSRNGSLNGRIPCPSHGGLV